MIFQSSVERRIPKKQAHCEYESIEAIRPLKCYPMNSSFYPLPSTNHESSKRLFIPKDNIKMSQKGVIIDYSLKQNIVQSFQFYNLDEQIRHNPHKPTLMQKSFLNHIQSRDNTFDLNNCYLAEISSDKILLKNKRTEERNLLSGQNSQSTVDDYSSCADDEYTSNEALIRLRNRLGLNKDVHWDSAFKPVYKKDFAKKRQIFDKTTMQAIQQKDEVEIIPKILFNQKNDNISYNDDENDYQFKHEEDIISKCDDQQLYLPITPKKKANKNKRKSPKKSRCKKTGINLADDGYYHCPFCERIFTQGQQLGGHCSRAHPGQSKIYQAKMEKRRLYYQSLPNYYQTFSKPSVSTKKKFNYRKRP